MFKLFKYPKHLNPHDWRDETQGKCDMEAEINKMYELGFIPYGIASTEHEWEVLFGSK